MPRLSPDVGLCTDAWLDQPLDRALGHIGGLADVAEIYSADAHSLLLRSNRVAAAASGLQLTVHGPYSGLKPGSIEEHLRRRAMDAHRRHAAAAAEVGAKVYVVHPDWETPPQERSKAVVDALQRTLYELEGLQDELGMRIALENNEPFSHFTSPGDLELGGIGLVLDAGHALICGNLDAWLAQTGSTLAHVHLQDNHGPEDTDDPHLALGRGIVDAVAVFGAARASGALIILELLNEVAICESIKHVRRLGLV